MEETVDGQLGGFHIELIRHVAQKIGWEVKFLSFPWKRALHSVQSGDYIALTYLGFTTERAKDFIFLDGNIISYITDTFIAPKGNPGKVAFSGDINSLTHMSVGYLRGFSHGDAFDKATFKRKVEVNEMSQLLSMVGTRRLDLGVVDSINLVTKVKRQGIEKEFASIELLKPHLGIRKVYIAFSVKKNALKQAQNFAAGLSEFKKTSTYQQLKKKYSLSLMPD